MLAIILNIACAKIYYSPDAYARARTHKLVAIAPPKVSIAAVKKVDGDAMKEQQRTESLNFQKEMYSWLLRRKMQNTITVDIQDVETTNAKLRRGGYSDDNPLSPAEICALLEVDGLITSNYALSKPMSDGAAIATGLLVGAFGSTNSTKVTLELHDRATQKLLWNYNHEVSGGIGSSPAQLVDNLMRNASKNSPYTRK